jgi:hypothetical protein
MIAKNLGVSFRCSTQLMCRVQPFDQGCAICTSLAQVASLMAIKLNNDAAHHRLVSPGSHSRFRLLLVFAQQSAPQKLSVASKIVLVMRQLCALRRSMLDPAKNYLFVGLTYGWIVRVLCSWCVAAGILPVLADTGPASSQQGRDSVRVLQCWTLVAPACSAPVAEGRSLGILALMSVPGSVIAPTADGHVDGLRTKNCDSKSDLCTRRN